MSPSRIGRAERNLKGLLGTKLGMTQTWDENNLVVPVTVIAAGTNVVTQVRTPEKDGYNAIQVGFGEIDGSKVTKPRAGHFTAAGVTPRRHVAEIRTSDAASYSVGQQGDNAARGSLPRCGRDAASPRRRDPYVGRCVLLRRPGARPRHVRGR